MDLTKIDLWSFAALLLPGLLLVQGYFFAKDLTPKGFNKDDLVVYPVFGLIYGLFLWFNGYAIQTGQTIFNLTPGQLFWLYILLPALMGMLWGGVVRFSLLRRLCEATGIPLPKPPAPPPPIRSAWVAIAPKISVGTYLMVILKDGTIYRALVTEDSHFSSDAVRIDLFLGQTFEGEAWAPTSPQRSVYIPGDQIRSIEVFRLNQPQVDQEEA